MKNSFFIPHHAIKIFHSTKVYLQRIENYKEFFLVHILVLYYLKLRHKKIFSFQFRSSSMSLFSPSVVWNKRMIKGKKIRWTSQLSLSKTKKALFILARENLVHSTATFRGLTAQVKASAQRRRKSTLYPVLRDNKKPERHEK